MRSTSFLLVGLAYTLGCTEASLDSIHVENAPERRIVTSAWDTLYEVGSTFGDTLLTLPRAIATSSRRLYVADNGLKTILAFDSLGALTWTYGKIGSGPGEFRNIVDIETDSSSNIWIADGTLSRVTVLSPEGKEMREFATRVIPRHIAVIGSGELVTTEVSSESFFATLDSGGGVSREFPIPLTKFREANPALWQMRTGNGQDGRTWTMASPFTARFFVYSGLNLHCMNNQVEVPDSVQVGLKRQQVPDAWTYSVSMSGHSVYMLVKGKTSEASKLVDEYSSETCRYIGSYVLPRKAMALSVSDGIFFVAYEDSTRGPSVLALRKAAMK